ncbi:MAG: hypothetical protein AB7O44_26640 [Hyphomicrobiaceae bacterium]
MTSRSATVLFVMQLALIAILVLILALGQHHLLMLNWRILLQRAGMTIALTFIGYAADLSSRLRSRSFASIEYRSRHRASELS